MKILHLLTSIAPQAGKISESVRSIINVLDKEGFVNEALTLDVPEADWLKNYEIKVFALGPRFSLWNFSSRLTSWLNLKVIQYDVIILHGLLDFKSYAVYSAWKRSKKVARLFVMPHGMLDPHPHFFKSRSFTCMSNRVLLRLIDRKLLLDATAVLYTSTMEMEFSKITLKGAKPLSEVVVGRAVKQAPEFVEEMSEAFHKSIGVETSEFWLCMCSFETRSGMALLIQSYLLLHSNEPSLPPLIVCGSGLDSIFGREIIQLCISNPNIIFTGPLLGKAKWGGMYRADVMIIPHNNLNLDSSTIEAISCGTPLLFTESMKDLTGKPTKIEFNELEALYNALRFWLYLPYAAKQLYKQDSIDLYLECYQPEKLRSAFLSLLR